MKKRLKSYHDFENKKVIEESLNAASRQMAGITMGGDPNQVKQNAQMAGGADKYRKIMMKWLAQMEKNLGANAPQSGEEAVDNFHPQAVQVLQQALQQAAIGKRQWSASQQVASFKKNNMPAVQQQAPQQQAPQQQQGGGPTPLSAIK